MSLTNAERPSAKLPRHFAATCSLLTCVCACSLSDYSYLGARRDASGGQGGGSRTGTSSSFAGGTAGRSSVSGGDAGADSSTTSSAGGNSHRGGNSAIGGVTSSGGSTSTSSESHTSGGTPTTSETTGMAEGGSTGNGDTAAAGAAALGNAGRPNGGASPVGGTTAGTTAPPPTTCKGCAVLDVPFTDRSQAARYFMRFEPPVTVNAHSGTGAGGSTSTITAEGTLKLRVFAPKLGNTQYQLLVQQQSGVYSVCFSGDRSLPAAITAQWVTLEWNLGTCATDTDIGRLGLDLKTSSAASDPTPSATKIWLDSISIELNGSTIVGPFNFDAASSVNATPVTDDWSQTLGVLYFRPASPPPPTGTTISWLNN